MKRTNIYLDDNQLSLLKHLAVEAGRSFTEMIRQAVQEFLDRYQKPESALSPEEWDRRLQHLLARLRGAVGGAAAEEIEADVTAAVKDSRRRRGNAARRH